jgi:hypothetical protein
MRKQLQMLMTLHGDAFDISSSEDEYEIPSSDDDDSIFGDPVSESDNVSHSHFHMHGNILSLNFASLLQIL